MRWDTPQYRRNRELVVSEATHCGLCREPLTDEDYPSPWSTVVDHIVARAVASERKWTLARINAIDNLQAAHKKCNEDKGIALAPTESPWEW